MYILAAGVNKFYRKCGYYNAMLQTFLDTYRNNIMSDISASETISMYKRFGFNVDCELEEDYYLVKKLKER